MKSIASSRFATVYASVPLLVIAVLSARCRDPHRTRPRPQPAVGPASLTALPLSLAMPSPSAGGSSDRPMRGGELVFVRVVRFSDVTPERVSSLVARIDEIGP